MRPIPIAIYRTIRIALVALTGMMATNGFAFDASDPFATDAITPLPPQIAPLPESSFIPCLPMQEGTAYGVLEVVDRALCQNPRTREAWANARIQAALDWYVARASLAKAVGTLDSSLLSPASPAANPVTSP